MQSAIVSGGISSLVEVIIVLIEWRVLGRRKEKT